MKFGKIQTIKFGTVSGAYSIVTDREFYDSQITVTDYEADLLLSYFGPKNITVGNVRSNPTLSSKQFYLYPSGKIINLNIVFPKPGNPELRLYISERAGFKPSGGNVWFVFVRGSELWIGDQSEYEWRQETSVFKQDECEEFYQDSIYDTDKIKIATLQKRDVFARDRTIALERLKLSDYRCEFDDTHGLFLSRFSKMPFLEAHHLIPIGSQKEFKKPLDTVHNVFCLCPNCHRAVHHAELPTARHILTTLAGRRPILKSYSLDLNDLLGLYAVEDIV